jgi:hypothetical protein
LTTCEAGERGGGRFRLSMERLKGAAPAPSM